VQERLKEKGMRTGVCILMHGAPGTGKTATAYEIARQTGRDIIQVQVTDFKDKFVGESEAKLKKIFNNYRFYCQNCELAPILLFNEGDAILSKRTTNIERSVDQMSNALQNILLEEMENLEGIMIVTTNLTTNLDSAFERRFIFKVQFDKPDNQNKARIWKSMIEELSDDDSLELAESFDVSGGEIENIARKSIMEYVISGQKPNIKTVKLLAETEKLKTNSRPVVGFNPTNR
jgi:SpoVK/Ycf46/Vps4 family AAA+-type ATPase